MSDEVTLFAGLGLIILVALAFFKLNESIGFSHELILVFVITVVGIGGLFAYSQVR